MSASNDKKELRKFGLVMAAPLALLGAWFTYKNSPANLYFFAAAGTFLLAALAFPLVLAPVEKVWMRFAELLGAVMTRVILSLTFFVVITPLGLMLRLIGKDFLDIDWKKKRESYWRPVETDGPAGRPEKPY